MHDVTSFIRPLPRDPATLDRLLAIWESAVRETHHFLAEVDILALRPAVGEALAGVETLLGWWDAAAGWLAFLGVEGDMLEMLFVDAAARGRGLGGRLLRHSVETLGVRRVDVNEQNPQGVDFYRHMGFVQVGRSPLDGQGRPFPLQHMALQ